MNALLLLAQTPAAATPGAGDMVITFLPILGALGVFYWFMYRGQRKERDKVDKMLGALKRNDRVLTIGGVLATVVDVRDDEVVLKVDETNNVKMRFLRSAIKQVLEDAAAKPQA